MTEDQDDDAAQIRRRRLREALDDLAPDPMAVSDRVGDVTSNPRRDDMASPQGLSDEDLKREVPPHHGG